MFEIRFSCMKRDRKNEKKEGLGEKKPVLEIKEMDSNQVISLDGIVCFYCFLFIISIFK